MTVAATPSTPSPASHRAPGPGLDQTMRAMFTLDWSDVVQSYIGLWHTYDDAARIRVGPMVIHPFVRPEHIRHIMVTNTASYPKGASHDKRRIALGNGLLTSDGPFWQRQRRLIQPTYTPKGVNRCAEIMTGSSQEMLERWRRPAKSGQMLAINRRFKHSLETPDTFLYGAIDERRKQSPADDLLSMLMTVKEDDTIGRWSARGYLVCADDFSHFRCRRATEVATTLPG